MALYLYYFVDCGGNVAATAAADELSIFELQYCDGAVARTTLQHPPTPTVASIISETAVDSMPTSATTTASTTSPKHMQISEIIDMAVPILYLG